MILEFSRPVELFMSPIKPSCICRSRISGLIVVDSSQFVELHILGVCALADTSLVLDGSVLPEEFNAVVSPEFLRLSRKNAKKAFMIWKQSKDWRNFIISWKGFEAVALIYSPVVGYLNSQTFLATAHFMQDQLNIRQCTAEFYEADSATFTEIKQQGNGVGGGQVVAIRLNHHGVIMGP